MPYPHLPPPSEGTEYSTRTILREEYLTTGLFPIGAARHTLAELVRCPVLAIDFDLADFLHHAYSLADVSPRQIKEMLCSEPREEVEDLLAQHLGAIRATFERLEIVPTVITMSGYGYHVYLWTECGGHDIERMRAANRWLIRRINEHTGYALADASAKDAGTRLLRPPGTFNRKGEQPVEVLLIEQGDTLFTVPEQIPTGTTTASPFQGINGSQAANRQSFSETELVGSWRDQGYQTLSDLVAGELREGHNVRLQCPFHEGSSTDSAFLSCNDVGHPYLVCTSASDGLTYWDNDFVPPRQQAHVVAMLSTTARGGFRCSLTNIVAILTHDLRWAERVWFNERYHKDMLDDDPLRDSTIQEVRVWISDHYNFEPGKETTHDAIHLVASRNTRNPLTEWLDSLEWDGTNRASTWMERAFGCQESPYYKDVARKFLISACARAYEPGCKVDTVLMLIGAQGLGKSTLLATLAGPEWFDDTELNLNNKDCFMALARAWIYEVAELSSFKKSYAELVKGFISSRIDLYRQPYQRMVQEYPRHTVIVATSNNETPLSDPTGSRRYWPVSVKQRADLQWLERNRMQLWAEAAAAYQAGEQWHQTPAMEEEQRRVAEEFTDEDPLFGALVEWLERPNTSSLFTTTDVFRKALSGNKISNNRLGRLLRKCGAVPLKRRGLQRKWIKPGAEIPPDYEYQDLESALAHQETLNKVIPFASRAESD